MRKRARIRKSAAKPRLTALNVAAIKKVGYHRDFGEGAARNLYLQVTPGVHGVTKAWIFRFVSPVTGKGRWLGLGSVDDVKLAKARDLARAARETVKVDKRDPIEERRAEKAEKRVEAAKAKTFKYCADRYVAAHKKSWKNPKHRDQWETTLKTYVDPIIGSMTVRAVDTAAIMRVLEQEIAGEQFWQARPDTATRVRGRIEQILDWAKARDFRTGENPARWRGHIDKLLPAKSKIRPLQHHKAMPYAEVPAFNVKLRDREGTSAIALEFTILTAARTGEVIGARWEEIDLEEGTWTIPGSRMKSGKPHRVPLSDRALKILEDMPREEDGFVFPGARSKAPLSNMAMLELARDMVGDGITVHGFRSSFRDWAGEQTSYARETIEHALAHTIKDKTEASYARGDLFDKRRRLMAEWAEYCAAPEKAAAKAAGTVTRIRAEA